MSRTDPAACPDQSKDVRRKNFTVRFRGLDPDEGRYFLAGLADQLDGIQAEVATLTPENETLRQENQLLHSVLSEGWGKADGTGHRPGRERPQPGPAAGRLVDR
jgi:DivIVA domain-containing protein